MQPSPHTTFAAEDLQPNRLLAALPPAEWQRWRPHFECVDLSFGQVLCEPGVTQHHAWFPAQAIVSLMRIVDSGASAEIAMVGNEGFVGAAVLLGGGSTISRAEVQVAGQAFRITAQALRDAFEQCPPLRQLLLRHMQALMTQIAQTAVCARHHALQQRLCRLLLLRLDHLRGDDIATTHELLAHALGVRRESVTAAVLHLQAGRLVRGTRGHVVVLDRERLAQRSCECYAVVKKETGRLLPGGPKAPAVSAAGAVSREYTAACVDHA
jgi:CRP-like cAMP-binding protein